MQRVSRKRKLTEKALNNPELERFRIKTEIKSEPDGEPPPLPALFCYLCKLSSGVKLLVLQANGPKQAEPSTVDKIKACIGWEIMPEMDETSRICRPCLRKLGGHYDFWKQALQCNNYAQNQMAADEAEVTDAPAEIRVCRFCLKIGGKLLDLHPQGDDSDVLLLKQIRNSLGVEVNSEDAVTKICRACIQRIQDFLDFREKHLPISVFVKQENGIERPEESNASEQEDETFQPGNDLDLEMCISDSDCSIDESERTDPLTKGKLRVGAISAELSELLGTEMDGRNFLARKDDGEKFVVIFEGYQYRFFSMQESGGSSWVCLEKRLRSCRAKLEIDPTGKRASVIGRIDSHTHSNRPAKLMECPAGKGFAECNGTQEPFWFFHGEQTRSSKQTRSIIFKNYRYFLHQIRNNGTMSVWYCIQRAEKCRCILNISRIFQRIEIKSSHNHKPVTQKKIDAVLDKIGIGSESTEAISAFQRDVSDDEIVDRNGRSTKEQQQSAIKAITKEKQPEIYSILSVEDPERKFECFHAGPKMKIKKDGYEYRYFGKQEDGSTLWKCTMDSLLHCSLVVRVDKDGRSFDPFKGTKHSHKIEPATLFGYALGKRMIGDEPLWLIPRFSMYYEGRCVIYREHVYIILDINRKGIVRWKCLRNHSCKALLIVKGDFEELTFRKTHSHEKTAQEILTKLIEGHSTPMESDEELTFKQRLLSYPSTVGKIWNETTHQFEPFYILKTMKTGETVTCGLVFHKFRYVLATVDQNETSRWTCTKHNIQNFKCKAAVIVEGLYDSICIKNQHNHEAMLDSEVELMIKRSVADTPLEDGQSKGGLVEMSDKAARSSNVLSLLARQDLDRNFEVTRVRSKLIIRYEDEDFRLRSRQADGTSLWSCTWLKIRLCPVVLSLSADGKRLTPIDSTKEHNHSVEQVAVYHMNLGKGQIYDENRRVYSSYWLFGFPWEYRESRGMIYQGNKYYLNIIGNNQMSSWKCRIKNCKAYVRIEGTCKTLFHKHQHIHDRLADDDILAITNSTEVDQDLLEDVSPPEITIDPKTQVGPLRPITLQHVLSSNDPDRNFHVTILKDQMKIHQHRYEYYYRSSNETHSLWKCVFFTIRRCRATLHLSNDCKTATLPDVPKHNHRDELWDMFYYPLGKHSIMDAYTETVKPFWFLMQPGFFRSHPMLIYEENKFTLASITENGDSSRWRCVAHLCRATLTVTGLFELVVGGHPHNHEPQPESKRIQWIRQYGTPCGGNAEDDTDVIPFVKVEMEDCDSMAYEDDTYVEM